MRTGSVASAAFSQWRPFIAHNELIFLTSILKLLFDAIMQREIRADRERVRICHCFRCCLLSFSPSLLTTSTTATRRKICYSTERVHVDVLTLSIASQLDISKIAVLNRSSSYWLASFLPVSPLSALFLRGNN